MALRRSAALVASGARRYSPVHTPPKPVIEQYDNEQARQFYQIIMGDGGFDIHYGIFDVGHQTTAAASLNTIETLKGLMEASRPPIDSKTRILDLGSGHGGAAHVLAQRTGANIVCLNLCPKQNKINRDRVKELGLTSKITVVEGNFEELPKDWTDKFDRIWSQDAFVHSEAKHVVLAEAFRVLKPGGRIAFSDIMAGENATPEGLAPFKKRLHVNELFTMSQYVRTLESIGYRVSARADWSHHLARNYLNMAGRIVARRADLTACDPKWLDTYEKQLRANASTCSQEGVQAWCALTADKPKETATKKS